MEANKTLGRRKEASARVTLVNGAGAITVNGKDYKTFFPQTIYQLIVEQPFKHLEQTGKFDVTVNVIGGGVTFAKPEVSTIKPGCFAPPRR